MENAGAKSLSVLNGDFRCSIQSKFTLGFSKRGNKIDRHDFPSKIVRYWAMIDAVRMTLIVAHQPKITDVTEDVYNGLSSEWAM